MDGFSTAARMLAALEARELSAQELLALHEARIARHNAALNVIIARDLEATRAAAQAAHLANFATETIHVALKSLFEVCQLGGYFADHSVTV